MTITVNEDNIQKLLAYSTTNANGAIDGFNEWNKGSFRRLYINSSCFGLRDWFTKSTGFHHAELRDLSGTKSREYLDCKNYIDLATGKIISCNKFHSYANFQQEFEDLVVEILGEDQVTEA